MQFTAEHGHYNFIFGTDVDALGESNQRLVAASEKAGRQVKSIAGMHAILATRTRRRSARCSATTTAPTSTRSSSCPRPEVDMPCRGNPAWYGDHSESATSG
jgi:hypothetical protein